MVPVRSRPHSWRVNVLSPPGFAACPSEEWGRAAFGLVVVARTHDRHAPTPERRRTQPAIA